MTCIIFLAVCDSFKNFYYPAQWFEDVLRQFNFKNHYKLLTCAPLEI